MPFSAAVNQPRNVQPAGAVTVGNSPIVRPSMTEREAGAVPLAPLRLNETVWRGTPTTVNAIEAPLFELSVSARRPSPLTVKVKV